MDAEMGIGLDLKEQAEGRQHRNNYWASLRTMKIEYSGAGMLVYYEPTDSGFSQYVRDTYGIRIQFDHSGNITADYTVEDEKLYLVYLMKHGR